MEEAEMEEEGRGLGWVLGDGPEVRRNLQGHRRFLV